MNIAVLAGDKQWNELLNDANKTNCMWIHSIENFKGDEDALLILEEVPPFDFTSFTMPVLINSVCETLGEMQAPENVIRLNGWSSFLSLTKWEIAGKVTPAITAILSALDKEALVVPDKPGFVSPRIISMIINEAYFALGENISTKDEIDLAMKLGTNYPYGPFEWSSIIGADKIFALLQKLSSENKRYFAAPLLKQEATA